ncbi:MULTISPECIES: sigma 54-interacting transcriptional regulator [unclassified Sedimentibacter]|uniref:sigma 54-interacting transcriptional regulator n=1 Tax=unclassified Sedimentibacter TaxID=2649220 RepID=UPI0027DEC33F|nr:sigma 54-interacting transcriptional regulator [Sedimentibacter sp. MB35-C1]WMJ76311.1 sigma 54-interacting transcriptional regulator [Sedimentibacter sp. MB35-C1]
MKKILIISEGINTGTIISNQLKNLFGKRVNIESVIVSELKSKRPEVDLVLYTSAHFKNKASRYIDSNIPSLIARRIINHKNIKEIITIDENKDVLFVNDSYESTKEAIEQLIELGLDHVRYNPYYPGCAVCPDLQITIVAGESQLVPYKPEKLIDIGSRILDIQSVHEIASVLKIEKQINDSQIKDYIRDIIDISKEIDESRKAYCESEQKLQLIVNNLDYGVSFINSEGTIMSANSKFGYIFGLKTKDLLAKNICDMINLDLFSINDYGKFVCRIENREVSVEIRQVNFLKKYGYIVSAKINKDLSASDVKYNQRINTYVQRNLHNFNDYITINTNVIEMISRAQKFSRSDGTVLITGENGTGKEILAQAIHMNSYRSSKAFVPINIATLTSSLVEAELFGYEEGTFTGAIKGGRMGIFEIANGGTIFIDEIGDIPIDIQTKLLRVLEEKRIRKIGAADELSVDVRIIAATNKNIIELIKENKFRQDLFYRLNILPLETIPLRRRRDDVQHLLKHFINIKLSDKQITSLNEFFEEETIRFLLDYQWPGNVREMLNLIEYLALIYEGEKAGMSLLHSYMRNTFKTNDVFLDSYSIWVLNLFAKNENMALGRIKIAEMASELDEKIGEGKIRKILKELKDKQLIVEYKKQGSRITEKGKRVMEKYSDHSWL